jgi:alpha-N-arabinofuranosidase
VASTIEYVRAKKCSSKQVTISFDEWNVWYHSKEQDRAIRDGSMGWPQAPRLLEDIYNFEDVLQVGCILNTFIRRADVIRIACIAQLVNVIAPIMKEPGGDAWRQTIYYPYFFASQFGRGTSLRLAVDSPAYNASVADDVPTSTSPASTTRMTAP